MHHSRLHEAMTVTPQFSENSADVRTSAGSTTLENLRNIFGNTVARELLEVR